MRYGRIMTGASTLTLAFLASAGTRDVQYAETPRWVIPVPAPTASQTPDGAPLRVVYSDYQIHLTV